MRYYALAVLACACLLIGFIMVPIATKAVQPQSLTEVLDWHTTPTHTTSPLFNLGTQKPTFTLKWICGAKQSFTLDMWAKSGVPIIFNMRPVCDGAWHQQIVPWQSGAPDREYITISPAYAHIQVLH